MLEKMEPIYYYITVMNENYSHPAMPKGAEANILKGMYLFREGQDAKKPRVQLMGSGTIFREVIAAAELLNVTGASTPISGAAKSFNEFRRDGLAAERWNLLHPGERRDVVSTWRSAFKGRKGPVIASTDYMRSFSQTRFAPSSTTASSPCPGNGWFRALGYTQETAQIFRGQSLLRGDRRR